MMIFLKKQKNNFLPFMLGFLSILSQIVILRELIVVFYGNEMAYAIILGSWLFGTGVGAQLGAFFSSKIKDSSLWLKMMAVVLFVLLPVYPLVIRLLKIFLDIRLGEIIGLVPMAVSSFLLVMPVTVLFGAMYTLLCQSHAVTLKSEQDDVGVVYLWESLGAALGGVLFSFVLIHFCSSFQILFTAGCLNLFLVVKHFAHKGFRLLAQGCFVVLSLLLLLFVIPRIDAVSVKKQWKDMDVVTSVNSIYSNLTLVQSKDVFSLYENGVLSFTTQDDLTSEENVHYALLAHKAPKNVLLVGNGIGGTLDELLKYKDLHIDYVELDGKVIDVAKQYLPVEDLMSLKNERVHLIYSDARYFIKTAQQQYDIVLLNVSDPYTATLNRYYTVEFFEEVKRILLPGGMMALSVSSAENYLSKQNRAFLQSINTTLKQVYPEVKSLPGENHIFLASQDLQAISTNPQQLIQRHAQRGVVTKHVTEFYIPFRLSADRVAYIEEVLKVDGLINRDFRPIAYFFDMLLFSSHFDGRANQFIAALSWLRLKYVLSFLLLLFCIIFFWGRKRVGFSLGLSIMTTGFCEIIFQIIVIVAFQSLYGFAYYKIGLIVASFMGGLVAGTMLARKWVLMFKETLPAVYLKTQIVICVYPFVLPLSFYLFRDVVTNQSHLGLFSSAFALLPFIAGMIGGVQYPIAVALRRNQRQEKSSVATAGFFYSLDLLGAFVGAMLTGVILIPLLGVVQVSMLCGVINVAVLLLLFVSFRFLKAA